MKYHSIQQPYERDDGPLSHRDLQQVKKLASAAKPKGKSLSRKTLLLA